MRAGASELVFELRDEVIEFDGNGADGVGLAQVHSGPSQRSSRAAAPALSSDKYRDTPSVRVDGSAAADLASTLLSGRQVAWCVIRRAEKVGMRPHVVGKQLFVDTYRVLEAATRRFH
jgi:hypothetical protein